MQHIFSSASYVTTYKTKTEEEDTKKVTPKRVTFFKIRRIFLIVVNNIH